MQSQDNLGGRGGSSGLLTPRQDARPGARAVFSIDRPSLEHLLGEPSLCAVDRIRCSIEQALYDDAAIRALARLQLGLDVPAEMLLEILTCLEVSNLSTFIALVRQIPTETLIDRLRHGHFGDDFLDVERTALVAVVAWLGRSTDEIRAQLVPLLRRAARWHTVPFRGLVILGWLVVELDDVHLRQIYESRHDAADTSLARLCGESLCELWKAPLDRIIALLPQQINDPIVRAWAVKARPPKVGVNELCPCGSGKKFKKCHVGQPEALLPVRPSQAELFRIVSETVEADHIRGMTRSSLAALHIRLLKPETLTATLRAFAFARDWARARQARDELAHRLGKAQADRYWYPVVYEAIRARQYDVARALFKELAHPEVAEDLALELELHDLHERNREVFERLERAAEAAVRHETPGPGVLARALLHKMPALGILVARGVHPDLCDAEPQELTGLLYEVEDARNALALPPTDPAWGIYGLSDGEDQDNEGDEDSESDVRERDRVAADLQGKLDQTTRRLKELERQLAEQAREQARDAAVERSAATAMPPATAVDAEQRARQKQRIEELEGLVRAGNTERGELRRALAELTSRSATPAAPTGTRREASEPHEDQFIAAVEPAGGRRVLVPAFSALAETALGTVPGEVAAATMVAVGRLAAGEAGAWRRIKQAFGTTQQVLMARVGIHHRLLFRTDEGRLEVLDLVTREALQTTLKRMRA